jgi:hypothetical protein
MPVPAAARSKAWDIGRWLDGIEGSNPAGDMYVCPLIVLYVVKETFLRLAHYLYRGLLPTVVCLSMILKTR